MIVAVFVPRCSSASNLIGLPPMEEPGYVEHVQQVLRAAFRVPWPHRN